MDHEPISIAIIAKNAERTIEACLMQARKLARELVLVDSGSTDRTLEIAQKYCDRIISSSYTYRGEPYLTINSVTKIPLSVRVLSWTSIDYLGRNGLSSILRTWGWTSETRGVHSLSRCRFINLCVIKRDEYTGPGRRPERCRKAFLVLNNPADFD